MEALFCTLIVDAHEVYNVLTYEIPGAYMYSYITKEKRVLMKLGGNFVDIMCQVNPDYNQHVRCENGKKVLHLLVIREIYGFTESALLWYNLFFKTI